MSDTQNGSTSAGAEELKRRTLAQAAGEISPSLATLMTGKLWREHTQSMSETRVRVIAGVIGAVLLLAPLYFDYGVSLIAAILGALMCFELGVIFYSLSDAKEKLTAITGICWLSIFVNSIISRSMLECLVLGFLALFTYYLVTADRHENELRRHFEELVFTTFILVYVVTFMSFFPLIRFGPNGIKWVFLFFIIVWAGDTGAYFAGHRYGKTKLYPLISPGKTVEGAGGGLAASVVATILFKLIFFRELGWVAMLIVPVLVGATSQIGDLCESLFKRAYKIKDSSHILPGHGGILDRFDGILFSLPVMYSCVKLFG